MKIILASKSGVRKDILDKYKINSKVIPSNVDEDQVKESLLEKEADPELISKNLAELKSVKVSVKNPDIFKETSALLPLDMETHGTLSPVGSNSVIYVGVQNRSQNKRK